MGHNYVTTIQVENSMYKGSLFDTNKGEKIYETKLYNSQSQVTEDVAAFLLKQEPEVQKAYTNRVVQLPVAGVGISRKCCGQA